MKLCKSCKKDLNDGSLPFMDKYSDYCYMCGEELHVLWHQALEEFGLEGK